MEQITIGSGRSPEVRRLSGTTSVMLELRGTRAEKVRDRDMLVRVSLAGAQAARLWRELGDLLTAEEKVSVSQSER